MNSEVKYILTNERLEGRGFLDNISIHRPDGLCLLAFSSPSFNLSVWADMFISCGSTRNDVTCPDPVTLFAALDKIRNKFDDNALMYHRNVDFCLHGAVFKRDMKNPTVVYYNWPSSWLADLHTFRKFYDNFARNFNPKNYMIL